MLHLRYPLCHRYLLVHVDAVVVQEVIELCKVDRKELVKILLVVIVLTLLFFDHQQFLVVQSKKQVIVIRQHLRWDFIIHRYISCSLVTYPVTSAPATVDKR